MLTAFAKGLRLGLLLQLSVGPIFLFVLQTAIARGIADALAAVLAVTLVDAGYIILALLGVGTWLNQKQQLQTGLLLFGCPCPAALCPANFLLHLYNDAASGN